MATETPPTLATMLKERRKGLDLSQREAGELIGVSERGYRYWENGGVEVPQKLHRQGIARFLGLPFTEVANVINGADLAETESRMRELVRQVLREETQSDTESA